MVGWQADTAAGGRMNSSLSQERVVERIRKIWALAQQGEAGEQENALRILEKILSDNGISLEDVLQDEVEQEFRVILKNDFDRELLVQTYCKVTSQASLSCFTKGKSLYFFATKAHGVETISLFSLYKDALQENLSLVFKAFIHKNRIFNTQRSDDDDQSPLPELTRKEREELLKVQGMMSFVDHVKVHKMIEEAV